jgi:uncharacterized membrane protein
MQHITYELHNCLYLHLYRTLYHMLWKSQSCAPEDGHKFARYMLSWSWRSIKLLLLHLVGVPYYFTHIDDERSNTNDVYIHVSIQQCVTVLELRNMKLAVPATHWELLKCIDRNSQSKTEGKATLCIRRCSEDDYVKMDKKFQTEFICLRIWLSRGTLRPYQTAGSRNLEVLL